MTNQDKIQWTSIGEESGNFQTKKLVETAPGRYAFRPTTRFVAVIVSVSVIVLGFAGVFVFLLSHGSHGIVGAAVLGLMIFGAILFLRRILKSLARLFVPMVIDVNRGHFYHSRGADFAADEATYRKSWCNLDDIDAIQLIDLRVQHSELRYPVFEMNLVLKTAARIHLVSHGDKEAILGDATRLAEVLDVNLLRHPPSNETSPAKSQ